MSNPVETTRRPARIGPVAVFALLTTLLAGCGSGQAAVPPTPASLPGRPSAPQAALFGISSDTLGWIVIDAQGYVLYRSDLDSARPPRSACTGECANDWIPVPATDPIRVEGIDRQLIGTMTRPDGTRQLTLAGWPLYGYSGDRMPGDTNGHGLNGQWHAVTPIGLPAGPTPTLP
jgi:predicted lipoprotein with Yx(FWY)xxD motif